MTTIDILLLVNLNDTMMLHEGRGVDIVQLLETRV